MFWQKGYMHIFNRKFFVKKYEVIWFFCMKLWFKVSVTLRKLISKSKSDEFAENFELELWLAETFGIISTKRQKES